MTEDIKQKNYWLFTTNYLLPFKGFFETYDEAMEKLYSIMTKSEPWFKEKLRQEALEHTIDLGGKETTKHKTQRDYEEFKGYTSDHLITSITFIECKEFNEDVKELVFTKVIYA